MTTRANAESAPGLPVTPVDRWLAPLNRFLHIEAASGVVLLACTAVALVVANFRAAAWFASVWKTPQSLLVNLVCAFIERHDISQRPVQRVVDPLGHVKEVWVPRDHQPAGVDADAARVAQQGGQHLGHAAAHRRRVDVPEHSFREAIPGLVRPLHRFAQEAWPLEPGTRMRFITSIRPSSPS
jgi:hypothetical protein